MLKKVLFTFLLLLIVTAATAFIMVFRRDTPAEARQLEDGQEHSSVNTASLAPSPTPAPIQANYSIAVNPVKRNSEQPKQASKTHPPEVKSVTTSNQPEMDEGPAADEQTETELTEDLNLSENSETDQEVETGEDQEDFPLEEDSLSDGDSDPADQPLED